MLFRVLIALVPAGLLLFGSLVWFAKESTLWSFLQLFGAACLVVVVFTHLAEALNLFSSMGWGLKHSVGHYIDLWSAIFGLTLFPVGYLFHALTKQHT